MSQIKQIMWVYFTHLKVVGCSTEKPAYCVTVKIYIGKLNMPTTILVHLFYKKLDVQSSTCMERVRLPKCNIC